MSALSAPRKRVTKAPAARRKDLLDAARRVFAARGIPQATVSEVTETAGVAKGTFYLYFGSKEELLGALKHRFVDDLIAEASALFERVGREDWWALAEATVDAVFDFLLENRDLIQVFAQEGLTPESRQIFARADAKLRDMFAFGIKAGMEAGAFSVDDPEMVASFLDHGFHGTLEHAILYEPEIDRERLTGTAKAFIRKVLAPADGPGGGSGR